MGGVVGKKLECKLILVDYGAREPYIAGRRGGAYNEYFTWFLPT